jgi:hypothetical protein
MCRFCLDFCDPPPDEEAPQQAKCVNAEVLLGGDPRPCGLPLKRAVRQELGTRRQPGAAHRRRDVESAVERDPEVEKPGDRERQRESAVEQAQKVDGGAMLPSDAFAAVV